MNKQTFPVTTEIQVRFSDADAMGHVNNAVYLTYFEQARVAFFKKVHQKELSQLSMHEAFNFIIGEIGIKYLSPAMIEEVLVVGLRVAEIRNKAFRFEYDIREKESHRPVASGYSVQVMYDYEKRMTFEVPLAFKEQLISLM